MSVSRGPALSPLSEDEEKLTSPEKVIVQQSKEEILALERSHGGPGEESYREEN
jgi:hypothetical protein